MADQVQLTDLDVITRYSLAVRTASADRAELIATLQSDLQWLQGGDRPAPQTKTARKPAAKTTKMAAKTARAPRR